MQKQYIAKVQKLFPYFFKPALKNCTEKKTNQTT